MKNIKIEVEFDERQMVLELPYDTDYKDMMRAFMLISDFIGYSHKNTREVFDEHLN